MGQPPNLVLRTVFIDSRTSFEVWSPREKVVLLPQEAELLKRDILRVEVICSRLVWLMGATCSEQESSDRETSTLVYDWEEVRYFASKYNFRPDFFDVVFCPQTIRPIYRSGQQTPECWSLEPANWEIFFLSLKPTPDGFIVKSRTVPLRVQLWTGKPIAKSAARSRSPG